MDTIYLANSRLIWRQEEKARAHPPESLLLGEVSSIPMQGREERTRIRVKENRTPVLDHVCCKTLSLLVQTMRPRRASFNRK